MKLEMDDNTAWLTLIVSVLLTIATISLGACQISEQTKREAMRMGYTQKQTPTSVGTATVWVKANPDVDKK